MPTLVRKLQGKKTVVFHCALSQERGPGAALKYTRATRKKEAPKGCKEGEAENNDEQTVYVLDRGFVGWQEEYGEDERLTTAYSKEIWKDGY